MTTVSLKHVWRHAVAATVYMAVLVAPGLASSVRAQGVLVDRLVATVGDQALTWRDVEAARLLGSIPATGTPAESIERVITRELMHIEVTRLAVVPPIEAAIDERLERARQRAGGADGLARALARIGLSEARARDWVAADIRIDVYVDQRFTAAAQPTDAEVAQTAAAQGAAALTPDERDAARRRLVQVRRAALVADWIAGIRARTSVQVAGGA